MATASQVNDSLTKASGLVKGIPASGAGNNNGKDDYTRQGAAVHEAPQPISNPGGGGVVATLPGESDVDVGGGGGSELSSIQALKRKPNSTNIGNPAHVGVVYYKGGKHEQRTVNNGNLSETSRQGNYSLPGESHEVEN
ncbi:unnamed protein product, partial [marine sediment metagenome]